MQSKDLLDLINKEMDIHVKKLEDFDVQELVDSYNLGDQQKPLVRQYVQDTRDYYISQMKIVNKSADDYARGVSILGLGASVTLGALIGAIIGYVSSGSNGAAAGATSGALIGGAVEFFFNPVAHFLVNDKYTNKICQNFFSEFLETREVYHKKTLMKLEQLTTKQ